MANLSLNKEQVEFLKNEFRKIQNSIRELSKEGWYCNFDMQIFEINNLADGIIQGDINKVNQYLIDRFDSSITNYTYRNLIKNFPDRKGSINSAFEAHDKKDYYASIPIFFLLIEGTCVDLINMRFFSKDQKNSFKPFTSKYLNKYDKSLLKIMLEPLNYDDTNRQGERKNGENRKTNPLNRHDVMHGKCKNYGDFPEVSYKLISLLNLLGIVLFKESSKRNNKATTK